MNIREIILDTETTGLDPYTGHRIIEIGCVELIDKIDTGKFFHCYINPERDVPEEAFKVHGLSREFLSDKPLFAEIVSDFLEFIGDAKLVIHNAKFDLKFINHHIYELGFKQIEHHRVIDTLTMARKKFPGAPASLDALSKRFNVDIKREKHGALLDSTILAAVYVELTGGLQRKMEIDVVKGLETKFENTKPVEINLREFPVKEEELEKHKGFLKKIKNPLWENV